MLAELKTLSELVYVVPDEFVTTSTDLTAPPGKVREIGLQRDPSSSGAWRMIHFNIILALMGVGRMELRAPFWLAKAKSDPGMRLLYSELEIRITDYNRASLNS